MDHLNEQITARISRAMALPKDWRVTTHYADGATKTHDTHEAGAENWATGERRKIGKSMINRATGQIVRVVAVTIDRIQ
jgi:hypothetical protein